MTLNAKIGGFMDFFGDFRLRHKSYVIHKVAPWNHNYAIQIENWYLYINLA